MGSDTVTLIDVSMQDHILHAASFEDNDGNKKEFTKVDLIPEALMNELDPFSGDGKGRITVGGELASNVKFFKAGAFVSIGVTCDSSLEVIQQVHALIQPVVQQLVDEDHSRMSNLRSDVMRSLTGESSAKLLPGQQAPVEQTVTEPGRVVSAPPRVAGRYGR
jgi:hypothetical protein